MLAVNWISHPSKSEATNSLLGSMFLFIISTLERLISKPITLIFLANSNAMGNPTYPNPITANLASLLTKLLYISTLFSISNIIYSFNNFHNF